RVGHADDKMARRILLSVRLAGWIEVPAGSGEVSGAVALLMNVEAELSVRRQAVNVRADVDLSGAGVRGGGRDRRLVRRALTDECAALGLMEAHPSPDAAAFATQHVRLRIRSLAQCVAAAAQSRGNGERNPASPHCMPPGQVTCA